MADDAELARRAAAGEQAAAGEIYDRYAPLVRAIALDATGSMPEANDLVQEVFVRALARLGQLRRPESLCGWLVGIARHEGMEYRRRTARRRRRLLPLVWEPSQPPDELASDDTSESVRRAVSGLPERERLAVHIHYLCGEPVEIARQALGLSPSGFYKLLEQARARLRARLLNMDRT